MPILDEKDVERMRSRHYSLAVYPEDSMVARMHDNPGGGMLK